MDEPILARLEAAEMLARERRLRAASEAERRIALARTEAATLEAGTDDAIREAVESLRERYRREAAADVAHIDAELAALDASGAALGQPGEPGPQPGPEGDRMAAAVELIVRAVLGEGN